MSMVSGPFNLCNLGRLVVSDCPMLKSLFSTSTAKTLTSMVTSKIEECSKLECVIKDEQVEENRSEEIVQDDEKCILGKLKILCLANLPSLINVHRQFKLQDVKLCQVHDCPFLPNQTSAAILEDLPQEYEITGAKIPSTFSNGIFFQRKRCQKTVKYTFTC